MTTGTEKNHIGAEVDVDHIATLARIHLTESEKEELRKNLASILEHFRELSSVNVDGIEPSAHAFPLYDVLREDDAAGAFDVQTALSNAPKQRSGLIIVPKVIE
ncbi:MAG: Asp-tRNA(Asn)/Glu-tRNA(Gln) amidotransferase subunit GatC [Puniceicoccales bacterium]|jgi:aspartyl-tRNA(Asn)/glutamyl-tRNA(Gln) amidotransferase subunit C|nr:Asp-tRNA(Asn)/Glu-tRNA(Gln) amidotransferase subunit GatC [Puniceicoccales bacterium]